MAPVIVSHSLLLKLCVVTLNDKHWTLAKEICKSLKYKKTADIVREFSN